MSERAIAAGVLGLLGALAAGPGLAADRQGDPLPPGARARVRCTCRHREVVFTTDIDWESWPDERLRAEIDRCLGEDGR